MRQPQSFPRKCKVESTNIESICYDPQTKEMMVQFKDTRDWYSYQNVIPSSFGALVSADSVGQVFHSLFRNNKSIKFSKET